MRIYKAFAEKNENCIFDLIDKKVDLNQVLYRWEKCELHPLDFLVKDPELMKKCLFEIKKDDEYFQRNKTAVDLALCEACSKGKTDTIKILLDFGADPNFFCFRGFFPFKSIVSPATETAIGPRFLLENKKWRTAYIVELLIKYGLKRENIFLKKGIKYAKIRNPESYAYLLKNINHLP